LKFTRIKGEPHELALGMACGIFAGLLPVIPFHTALALVLALLLKCSKITAIIGVWVSNPVTWYLFYFANYKLGIWILRVSEEHRPVAAILAAIQNQEPGKVIIEKMLNAGGILAAAFMLGGVIMGVAGAVPSYFICLSFFKRVKIWRVKTKEQRFLSKETTLKK
jgi:hypothetical protein